MSLGLLWQRWSDAASTNSGSQQHAVIPTQGNLQSSYHIQFPGLTPLVVSSALAYQTSKTGNAVMGLLGSLPLWLATPATAQSAGLRIVVPEFRVNSNTTSTQNFPAVASSPSGEWVVVWSGSGIYAQRFSANGSVLGPEFQVNSNTTGNLFPAITHLASGEWVMVWSGNSDIYAQRFTTNGSRLGSEFRVNSNTTGSQYSPAMTSLPSGEWVVVWRGAQTGDDDIYAQRFAANGSWLGSEFRVNNATSDTQRNPAVVSVSAGEWVVVWDSGGQNGGGQLGGFDIYAQRFAANGSRLGTEFRVNSATSDTQRNPAVVSVSAGEWVVVWYGYQTGKAAIYAQRFAANGSALGVEFRVNSNTIGTQYYSPAVASVSAGEWVVVWTGEQTGVKDIYAQRYATNGSRLGTEFRVNSNTTGDQDFPAVASSVSGEWVVVWQGAQTGDSDIYGSIFSSTEPLPITGFSTLSTSITSSSSVNSFTTAASDGMTSSVTMVTTSQTPTTSATTQQQATNGNSGVSETAIGAIAGVGGLSLAACAAAVGLYACKKSRAKPSNTVALNEPGASFHSFNSNASVPSESSNDSITQGYVNSYPAGVDVSSSKNQYNARGLNSSSSHYSNNIPSVPADPYAGVQFANLGELNREVDEQKAKEQQALHQDYDDVTVLAPKK